MRTLSKLCRRVTSLFVYEIAVSIPVMGFCNEAAQMQGGNGIAGLE
jgi:hypothetical protein